MYKINNIYNNNEENNKDLMYIWLSNIPEMSYIIYLRLLKIFDDISNLYNESKNKSKFIQVLNNNNIKLSKVLISSLTNFNLKLNSLKIYNNLKKQNICILNISSKNYPKQLFQIYNPPFCIYLYGKESFIKNKIVYLHYEGFNKYGKNIYDLISYYLKLKNIYSIKKYDNFKYILGSNEIYLKNLENTIFLHCDNILNVNYDFLNKFNKLNKEIKNILKKNVHIIIPKCNNNYYIDEVICAIASICIIPQAKYSKECFLKNMVDIFLELNKNILVCPGNIYCENNYFSNYLIKEGADVILNVKNIDRYIN